MIRVILESLEGSGVVATTGREGNEQYLCQSDRTRFPYLSQIDRCSYSVFARSDMPGLLVELASLEAESPGGVAEIAALVERCVWESHSVLTFTPFDE